jgi:hypothetical protein
MKRGVLIVGVVLFCVFLVSCDNAITGAVVFDPEIYSYPAFIDDCDRFRPIFLEELEKYPVLEETFDLPSIYSLVYQESLCKTKDELEDIFIVRGDSRETWKGGIMQVDQCWRGDMDCSTIRKEIESGMKQLDYSLGVVNRAVGDLELSKQDKIKLLLISYNRGYFVVERAMRFFVEPRTMIKVDCFEKDKCTNDGEVIDISSELLGYENFLDKYLLMGCRESYGYMADSQGDYCTGEGYGLNYPKATFQIYDQIVSQEVNPIKEKEFYIDELEFSGHTWLVKKSIGKTGPGPNYFYYDNESVFVDSRGELHLNILQREGKWYSSEIVLNEGLGYGKYTFYLKGDLSNLHPNVVLGLFTYDLNLLKDSSYHHREIDFEIAKWGRDGIDSQFTIQGPPLVEPTWEIDLNEEDFMVSFDWQKNKIEFVYSDSNGLEKMSYNGSLVPVPGEENARINLWIFGDAKELEEQEIVVKKFEYEKPTRWRFDFPIER